MPRKSFSKVMHEISLARENAVGVKENDRIILILRMNPATGHTEPCPFCGKTHIHGKDEGHRVAHCGTYAEICNQHLGTDYVLGQYAVFQNKKGEIFKAQDGYYLRHFGKRLENEERE